MLNSMTGYGRGEYTDGSRLYIVEAQAFNHRFLEVRTKAPKRLCSLEFKIHRTVQQRFRRGRFDLSVTEKVLAEEPISFRLNLGLAAQYLTALKRLQEELKLPGQVTVELLGSFQQLFEVEEEGPETSWGPVEVALKQALDALEAMRVEEGEALEAELLSRLASVEGMVDRVLQRASEVPGLIKERLQARLSALLEGRAIEPLRLEQELAIFADRSDITEEGARLKSHLGQFRAILAEGGPHGRKLDFLLQEMSREANTIGAKAADVAISLEVVALKAELERIREQVQNVE